MSKKKKTTISDIAKELNVTPSTVSRALGDHPKISDSTKEAVLDMVEKLNYQPNNIASALRKGKSNIIGVIVPTSDRQFFASIIRGIEEIIREEGYHLMICQSDDQFDKEKSGIDTLLNVRVDGIIASVAKETTDISHYKKIKKQGVPLVLYDRVIDSFDVNHVVSDDFLGAYNAVTHLIEQGCTRIAHFAGKQHIKIYQDRLQGYIKALREHSIPVDDELIIESDLIQDTYSILRTGRELGSSLLQIPEMPDGIFSSSDFAAMGAIQVFKEKNIKIPDKVALVGYSNDFSASVIEPALTSLDQHTIKMGNCAARLFLEQMNSKEGTFTSKRKLIVPELIVRKSSQKKQEPIKA
ncbi:LacI family DNA-binding transcriptional regulator [Rhodohalobacter sulfatireducens]|uniref:LacI family transcriptional regulator n=1 Tax=Rhodohalobacter sulfatireducens TaxID=2911366 RepID=A0ABS9KJ74_9BACT|nr:LacI family DNA-binding transcriptional regulator [Rhodohalobacter sulfatireducens]MCG2590879.1 LacI family transcriptional regulator [Rhodohalobacter sulfatireducens]